MSDKCTETIVVGPAMAKVRYLTDLLPLEILMIVLEFLPVYEFDSICQLFRLQDVLPIFLSCKNYGKDCFLIDSMATLLRSVSLWLDSNPERIGRPSLRTTAFLKYNENFRERMFSCAEDIRSYEERFAELIPESSNFVDFDGLSSDNVDGYCYSMCFERSFRVTSRMILGRNPSVKNFSFFVLCASNMVRQARESIFTFKDGHGVLTYRSTRLIDSYECVIRGNHLMIVESRRIYGFERMKRWRRMIGESADNNLTVGSSLSQLFKENLSEETLDQRSLPYMSRIDEVSEPSEVASDSTVKGRRKRLESRGGSNSSVEEVLVPKPLSSIRPSDSASNVSSSGVSKGALAGMFASLHEENTDLISSMATQLANMSDCRKRVKELWKERAELSEDLKEALEVSGTSVEPDGVRSVDRMPLLSKSSFVVQHTSDCRLNFLISIHVTLLEVLSDSEGYPCRDFLLRMSSLVSDSEVWEKFDSQYLDLLLIVLNDTFNFQSARVLNNRFCLPALEVGMRISEQLLGQMLTSLKDEYTIRWNNQFKDVQLPGFLLNRRWSSRTVKTKHGRRNHLDWSKTFKPSKTKR